MGTLRLNLPTLLTLSRIVLIPVFVFAVDLHPVFGALIFGIASLTDFLDGYLARRSGDITKFGIILDPIADKFLVISALIVLVDMNLLEAWIAITIIVREFLVTGLRVVALSKDIVIPAEIGGKIKTTIQIAAILCLILRSKILIIDLYDIGIVLIWAALVISIISGVQYTISFGKKYKQGYD
jgi:CDP-diacylglycerol--glycerol-3-phosphate 3-phosphatidyltransferase